MFIPIWVKINTKILRQNGYTATFKKKSVYLALQSSSMSVSLKQVEGLKGYVFLLSLFKREKNAVATTS